jgi:hypothetical protein
MSRIIKFRAWDSRTENWFESTVAPIMWLDGYDRPKNPFVALAMLPEEVTLEQLTGLKDLNRFEIYEGDILECRGVSGPVVWDETRGMWDVDLRDKDGLKCYYLWNHCKIIGNIHENPELIK